MPGTPSPATAPLFGGVIRTAVQSLLDEYGESRNPASSDTVVRMMVVAEVKESWDVDVTDLVTSMPVAPARVTR